MKKYLVLLFAALVLPAALGCPSAAYSADPDENWKTYLNARFGYYVEYPDIFNASKEPDNGDGIEFESADGEYTLAVWGGHNIFQDDGAALLRGCYDRVAHIVPNSEKSGPGFYSIEYSDDGGQDGVEHISHEYGVVDPAAKAGYILRYPKDEEKRFAKIKSKMDASLKLPKADSKPNDFMIQSGEWRRQSGGKLLDAPTPNGGYATESGWVYWLYANPEMSDEAKGTERGLYFYSEKDKQYSFMPFEAENVNALHFSPDGAMFVVEGPGELEMNDVSLELFTLVDKTSRFKTVKAAMTPQWIDARRFLFTRNEPGQPRDRPDDYPSEGTSAVMFDAISGEETVLKAATATSDFSVGALPEDAPDLVILSEDGGEILLTETLVDSPKDWADPDKAKERVVKVPVPAAG